MRITLITDTFFPEINGVSMTLGRLSEGLTNLGHSVEVIRPNYRNNENPYLGSVTERTVAGLPLFGYPGLKVGLPRKRGLSKIWKKERPDVIYVATEGLLGQSAISAAAELSIPVLSGYHTHFVHYLEHYKLPFMRKFAFSYLRNLHKRTALTLAPTESLANELQSKGFGKAASLGRGVDTQLFNPSRRSIEVRESWGVGDKDPVAIYVGRVAKEKNISLALSNLRHFRKIYKTLKVVVVGDGPVKKELSDQYPEVIWMGSQRGERLASIYASADMFVFPSESETYGNVIVEAMASGLVPVCYELAAAKEFVIDEVSGFLATPKSAASFRDAIRQALSKQEYWPVIREIARNEVSGKSWENIIAKFERYLLNVSNDRRNKPLLNLVAA
ncbi:MAG: hypothetical protein CBC36_08275 [Verrucomicrobiaceae bacterium TMED76]|nr:MAG: hypothetical protein CBC36_08275 [Verrucomicrobiaceae bacterium TMED76]|tara:strand:+ start:678 stop:1841 length:1164 start_codon:yes stop_codon:yes gene_type:complete